MALTKVGKEGITGISNSSDAIAITIDSSENVGIGETSPLGKLHVRTSDASLTAVNGNADDLIIENNGNCGMTIASSTTGEGNINFVDSGDTNIGRIQYNHSDNRMVFRTNDAERMRILSTGGVLMNRTSSNSAASTTLDIDAGSNIYCIVMTANPTNGAFVRFHKDDGSEIGSIDHTASVTRYLTSSDHRLKENVVAMEDATTRLKQLQPKRFNFIADSNDTTVDGFLAHEVQSVVPEAVSRTHNEVDDDGNPNYQGIDQSKLVPLLVKTIQELEARITALENA